MSGRYGVDVWREGDWWLARVVTAQDGADPAPVGAVTQATTWRQVEPWARDLIATVLDVDPVSVHVDLHHVAAPSTGLP